MKTSKIESEKIFEKIFYDEIERNWKRTLEKIRKEGEDVPRLVRDEEEKYEKLKRKRDKIGGRLDLMVSGGRMDGSALERKGKFLSDMWAGKGKKGCNLEDFLPMSVRGQNAVDVMGVGGGK